MARRNALSLPRINALSFGSLFMREIWGILDQAFPKNWNTNVDVAIVPFEVGRRSLLSYPTCDKKDAFRKALSFGESVLICILDQAVSKKCNVNVGHCCGSV